MSEIKHFKMKPILLLITCLIQLTGIFAQNPKDREHIPFDFDWRFAFGHPYDTQKDFNHGIGYFSYLAKAGYGDGAAGANFDARAWRKLDLPHDWAVEVPFDAKASHSHGYKAIGRNFPDASVGWYRKSFFIPESDKGRKISLAFDGIMRDAKVWVNGFYVGNHASGYLDVEFNISEVLNYGGENVVAVRVDVTMEEGWFYEGAGIYRHVWLNKTNPLHVATNGTFVMSEGKGNQADISTQTTIINEQKAMASFDISQKIIDKDGKTLATSELKNQVLQGFESKDFKALMILTHPTLWSLENPYLHQLISTIRQNNQVIDSYTTTFGVRTIRFDAEKGFFLNGKNIKLKGTNNHQDHAGVGAAMPDALQDFRIKTLKAMGSNAYRCSHNPPTPELLDACDRLGMLVIDENRLMGTSEQTLADLKKLILRDRNHPCIFSWSIGNEEWAIENSIVGERIAITMQDYTKTLDSTRFITTAISGGFQSGISSVADIMGYNYMGNGDIETHHNKFPKQPAMGTEEGSTFASRGMYETDEAKHYQAAYDRKPRPSFYSIEEGWTFYAQRDYLAGMFIWTGFDYKGEPTPYTFPSVYSYFGMVDACGFPKDNVYYLRAWWGDKPILHILPHWNWKGKEGQTIDVWAYSNADEVELFLNKKSQGRKSVPRYGHIEWKVKYEAGTLEAVGYKGGKKILTDIVKTTQEPITVQLTADKTNLQADKKDIAMITVQVNDKNNLFVPTAENEITFKIEGAGKIIGVGNGSQTSLEPEKFLESIVISHPNNFKEKAVESIENRQEISESYADADWKPAFQDETARFSAKAMVFRSTFDLPDNFIEADITFFYRSIGKMQSIYINGKEIAQNIAESQKGNDFKLDKSNLHSGKNSLVVVAIPLQKKNPWDNVNTNIGQIQMLYPSPTWKRQLFSGLAQVIIQSDGNAGEITLTAESGNLKKAVLKIETKTVNKQE
jgi:beta-galactosidase